MLTPASCEVAKNLAQILYQKQIALSAKPHSLVDEISKVVQNKIIIGENDVYKIDDIPLLITRASEGDYVIEKGERKYIESDHDALIDYYIQELSQLAKDHIQLARNTVKTQMKIFLEEFSHRVDNYAPKEAESFFDIKYFRPNSVITSDFIQDELAQYEYSEEKNPYNLEVHRLSNLEDFSIKDYLKTGINDFDSLLENWLTSLGEEKAKSYITQPYDEFALNIAEGFDYTLINFLFYRQLTLKADLNVASSLVELRQRAASLRDYFASRLLILLSQYNNAIKAGYLFCNGTQFKFSYLSDKDFDIYIYEETFEKFAEEGGTIDIIFGYLASGEQNLYVTYKELLDKKEHYLLIWKNTKDLYLIHINNNQLDFFKLNLIQVFDHLFTNELTDIEKEYYGENIAKKEEVRKKAYEYIDSLELSDLECLETISLELIARIRFFFTSSYFLLNKMYNYLKLSPEMNPQEAALYASIHYLVEYLISQVNFSQSLKMSA